ncbi:C1 family peptidase, partial [Klebsiella pneumoniae]|uniref:C1 family peptidase n=1 Tax=Klebsiella pneumoniae TaxID=573 RepID=UPI0038518D74
DNLPTTPLPAKYSSRDAGVVPSVRDQKQCGECWCFGAVGASEISAATLGKLSGNNIDWAEQG